MIIWLSAISNGLILQFGSKFLQQSISATSNKSWSVSLPTAYRSWYSVSFGLFSNSIQPIGIGADSITDFSQKTLTDFNFTVANRNTQNAAKIFGSYWITIGC